MNRANTSFKKKRQLASAFLWTVGAKALVVSEKKSKEECLSGLDEEFMEKKTLVLEADTRLFKRDMSLPPGVRVKKLGAGNKSREVHIQFAVLSSGAYGIVWKSAILKTTKTFDLTGVDLMSSDASENLEAGAATRVPKDEITLDNGEERLSLKFASQHQRDVFAYAISNIAHIGC